MEVEGGRVEATGREGGRVEEGWVGGWAGGRAGGRADGREGARERGKERGREGGRADAWEVGWLGACVREKCARARASGAP